MCNNSTLLCAWLARASIISDNRVARVVRGGVHSSTDDCALGSPVSRKIGPDDPDEHVYRRNMLIQQTDGGRCHLCQVLTRDHSRNILNERVPTLVSSCMSPKQTSHLVIWRFNSQSFRSGARVTSRQEPLLWAERFKALYQQKEEFRRI